MDSPTFVIVGTTILEKGSSVASLVLVVKEFINKSLLITTAVVMELIYKSLFITTAVVKEFVYKQTEELLCKIAMRIFVLELLSELDVFRNV